MFWPRVIAAPLWHRCSLDHLKPNEMCWGGIKGQSPPSLCTPQPTTPTPCYTTTILTSSLHSPIPLQLLTIQSWAARNKGPPSLSVLKPSPSLTQESSRANVSVIKWIFYLFFFFSFQFPAPASLNSSCLSSLASRLFLGENEMRRAAAETLPRCDCCHLLLGSRHLRLQCPRKARRIT